MLTFGVVRLDQFLTIKLGEGRYFTDITAHPDRLLIRSETEDYRMVLLRISRDGITVSEEKNSLTYGETIETWEEELYTVPVIQNSAVLAVDNMTLTIRYRKAGVTIRVDVTDNGTAFYLDLSTEEGDFPFTFGSIEYTVLRRFLSLLLDKPKAVAKVQ